MAKARFLFTKNQDSLHVYIENLEELSVEEIQKIEAFVAMRKGIFDFSSYTFFIPKKLDFETFTSLLWHVGIDATCKEQNSLIQSDTKIEFGQYKGMFYSELPDSYLVWLKSNYRGSQRDIITMELKQRNL